MRIVIVMRNPLGEWGERSKCGTLLSKGLYNPFSSLVSTIMVFIDIYGGDNDDMT